MLPAVGVGNHHTFTGRICYYSIYGAGSLAIAASKRNRNQVLCAEPSVITSNNTYRLKNEVIVTLYSHTVL